ncbi:Acetyltransferase (GNAT) family protein [Saccharopolyspora antimicrobica]|uniref:Acetyltransferase (GNAT) family protein n=1 Tax=Saccharopolyspora antimicrobica TaxID=455193 RepID=A0A1I4YH57_9PSEU|nr:GNAT family N-acetyltransferase [Saccharopolyspora antimicrobica]RKT82675.1 acetyltransferase (GNAT) family protein [Saccharopolyspora antimicrobica]SFN37384.1 Acetyltransferase (GNAT) family protein [Saccharopolyspora antimicrobica]
MIANGLLVRTAEPSELDRIAPAYAAAFADEAVVDWVMPDTTGVDLAEFFRPSVSSALHEEEVLVAEHLDGTIAGLSIWSETMSATRLRSAAAEIANATEPALQRTATVLGLIAGHHPEKPHLYLSAMAVVPEFRGSGAGTAMLRHRLAAADADRLPAYLEASTQRSTHLYARHGFRPVGTPIELPGNGPRLQPMWRDPVCG